MSRLVIVIPLAIEWVLLTNTFSPFLINRFTKRPNLGIAIWLSLFASVVVATVSAIAISAVSLFQLRADLEVAHHSIAEALALAIGPWLLLALAGVALSLTNRQIAPFFARSNPSRQAPILPSKPLKTFQGISVESLDLPVPIALCLNQPTKRILITSGALTILSDGEVEAVLWHEFAHLKLRHNQVRLALRLIVSVTRFVKATRVMNLEVEKLLELAADEFALRHVHRGLLVSARLKLAA